MTNREAALLTYFGTIAFDPRVQRALTPFDPTALKVAVVACLAEDFPAVLKTIARNGLQVAAVKADEWIPPAMKPAFGEFFRKLDEAIGDFGRPKKR